ncbi:DUF2254 domain-containing protein [Xylophilus sp. Leaf220]|uniref:DUF2254 domain-containing protein n=1 Tax=Xylophilus sp. Leaf220 TaxID=1735686 RepID=UPI000700BCE8|nr:DUF2254 domain-containing protein [Xylophilus sp. Leaf220]KQM69771.1 hypothetical protein ASE76_11540 [Xylophilus sp. Leaf220]
MSEKLRFLLSRLFRKTWWRCALFSLFAFLAVALSAVIGPSIPQSVAMQLGSESIDSLLGILASSMLTVAIFSATTMVASFSAVSNSATPRASQLLIEDSTVQNTLAAFIGAFLYSVIALVGLHAHVYGEGGRLVLFGFTLAMLVFVVVVLLRWIDYLSVLGRLGETIRRVELATQRAMVQRLAKPWLGGRPQPDGARGRHAVQAPTTGFVQHVSMDLLQRRAEALGTTLHLHVLPGAFVEPSVVLASCDTPLDEDDRKAIADALVIGTGRSFDHDPRFGLVVMGEIAARAMSASVNDPGTALDVMATAVKTLVYWIETQRTGGEGAAGTGSAEDATAGPEFDRVSAPALREAGMVEDVFAPLARYGAEAVEVGVVLQRALASLRRMDHPPFNGPLEDLSRYAIARAEHAGAMPYDVQLLRDAAAGRTPAR